MATPQQRRVSAIVAHLPGVKRAVHGKGREIQRRAEALFDEHDRPGGHRVTGEPVKADTVGARGQIDYLVSIEGPVPHIIEFGREGYTREDGTKVGPMEGLRILGRAVL